MERGGYIYILANKNNTVLYTGVTSNLKNRVFEHKEKFIKTSFTAKYNIDRLVYFETFRDIEEAIAREKQIKAGSRAKKEALINKSNPAWRDLYNEIDEYI
jgi:putative endonuclease